MKIEKEGGEAFVPRVSRLGSTIIVVPRDRFGADLVSRLLEATGAGVADRERHIDILLRRHAGDADWLTMARKAGRMLPFELNSFRLDDKLEVFGLPVSVYSSGDVTMRWTLDVYNPRNEECRLGCYDWNCEYLELLVDPTDLGSHLLHPFERDLEFYLPRQKVLNELISKAHGAVDSLFTFGTAYHHMTYFAQAFHFARGKVPRWLDFPNMVWQWAIYPPALQKKLKLDPRAIAAYEPQKPHDAMEALFVEMLPDSSALVYSILAHEFETARYAKTMGLKSAYGIKLKDVPLS